MKSRLDSKPKKGKSAPDFVKKKRKVGKRKLKPSNATNPVVRSKGLQVKLPRTADKCKQKCAHFSTLMDDLTIPEILVKLAHYNSSVRRDSVKSLRGILASNLLSATSSALSSSFKPSLLASIISKLIPLILDESVDVRDQAGVCFNLIFANLISQFNVEFFIPVIFRYVNLALTHPKLSVRHTGIRFLFSFITLAKLDSLDSNCTAAIEESSSVLYNLIMLSHNEHAVEEQSMINESEEILEVLLALLYFRLAYMTDMAASCQMITTHLSISSEPNCDDCDTVHAPNLPSVPTDYRIFLYSLKYKDPLLISKCDLVFKLPQNSQESQLPERLCYRLQSGQDCLSFFDKVYRILKLQLIEVYQRQHNQPDLSQKDSEVYSPYDNRMAAILECLTVLVSTLNRIQVFNTTSDNVIYVSELVVGADILGYQRHMEIMSTFVELLRLNKSIELPFDPKKRKLIIRCLLHLNFVGAVILLVTMQKTHNFLKKKVKQSGVADDASENSFQANADRELFIGKVPEWKDLIHQSLLQMLSDLNENDFQDSFSEFSIGILISRNQRTNLCCGQVYLVLCNWILRISNKQEQLNMLKTIITGIKRYSRTPTVFCELLVFLRAAFSKIYQGSQIQFARCGKRVFFHILQECVSYLPKVLWDTRLYKTLKEQIQLDILETARLYFMTLKQLQDLRHCSSPNTLVQQTIQFNFVKAIWSSQTIASQASLEDEKTVYGCFKDSSLAVQLACIRLLFYFNMSLFNSNQPPKFHKTTDQDTPRFGVHQHPLLTSIKNALLGVSQIHLSCVQLLLEAIYQQPQELPSPAIEDFFQFLNEQKFSDHSSLLHRKLIAGSFILNALK